MGTGVLRPLTAASAVRALDRCVRGLSGTFIDSAHE